jgi:hypothetical protein
LPARPLAASATSRTSERRPRHQDDGDEESRATVRGFGSDVPAFMLLRPRAVPVEGREGDTEA